MTVLTQVGALFAKVETTPGVEATPLTSGAGNDFILALEAQFSPDFQAIERNYMRPSISGTPIAMGRQLATLTFTTEVFGTGVAALTTTPTTQKQATPKWADLLLGCGFVGTAVATPAGQTFSPITSNQQTLTLHLYLDGILHKLVGSMGTFSLTAEAGQIARISWTFTGVYIAPTAVAVPAPDFTNITPPLVQNAGFAIGATASTVFVPQTISFDIGNTVTPRADANSAKGFNSVLITGRQPTLTFNPESVPEASHPFWADFAAATGKAITMSIGSTAGNKMLFDAANMQITGMQYADRDGIRVYDITSRVSTTSPTGNDEVVFKFV